MSTSKLRNFSGFDSETLSNRVREELARRRMTRQALADASKISISTLEKVLAGRRAFTLGTIVRLEEGLGAKLLDRTPLNGNNGHAPDANNGTAPDGLGNYNRAAVSWLEGSYLTLRPSFGERGAVYAYRTDISWDDATSTLVFRELERTDKDYAQFGSVAVPHQSGHIYLVTNRHGQHRMIVVAKPTIQGEMHGLLTTLQSGRGAHLSPVATPIVMKAVRDLAAKVHYGRIAPSHPAHASYSALLRKTLSDNFAAFLAG
ncbi:MAG: helix-turn-helix transcriptional regulator [Hyphomicrobium sp.]|nr:helix-turn-helix transcriptional regulator [Hyphomicrobium sp.]